MLFLELLTVKRACEARSFFEFTGNSFGNIICLVGFRRSKILFLVFFFICFNGQVDFVELLPAIFLFVSLSVHKAAC